MGGILDFASDPQGMQGLALLAAAAPSMTPMNFAGRLAQAGSTYQGLLGDKLKQQDLAQQIQLRNIQLQQATQQFEMMKPILGAVASAYANQGQGQPQAPSQPAIQPSGGGALGSGTFGIPMGGQPASAPSGGAGPSGSVFGVPLNVAGPTLALGGPAKFAETVSSYNAPTDLMKLAAASGAQPGTPEYARIMQGGVDKGTYIAPTRLGNAGYVDPRRGFIPLPANAPPGFINVPDATDPSGYRVMPIGGGPKAVGVAAAAKTAGEGSVLPYAGVDGQGRPLPVTNRTAAATQGQSDDPNIPPSTPYQRAASDVASIQREIDGVNRSMVPAATKKMQLDILNQELTKAQAATQPPVAAVSAPGQVYAAPPLGTVTNADAAQKASAQTMRDSYTKLQSGRASANNALDVIDKMLGIAAKKNPLLTAGVLGTNQSAINPDAAEYEKQRANLITQLASQNGTNGTDAGRALTGESVPDFGKPKSAIADGLTTLRNQTVVQQLKADFLTPVYQAGDSKKYTTLENQFDQNVSPALVPLLTMPAGPQRAAALKAAAQNPTLKARLNWAVENGLLK